MRMAFIVLDKSLLLGLHFRSFGIQYLDTDATYFRGKSDPGHKNYYFKDI